jgi:hypothetical protein
LFGFFDQRIFLKTEKNCPKAVLFSADFDTSPAVSVQKETQKIQHREKKNGRDIKQSGPLSSRGSRQFIE